MSEAQTVNNFDELELVKYRKDILYMIFKFWGLLMQPPKPEYLDRWTQVVNAKSQTEWEALKNEVTAEWFGDYNEETGRWEWYFFQKGKHITWQQTLILLGIRKASMGIAKTNVSVVSGHGTGKSATISWITIWFLFCHHMSQVAATAPTAYQMHDVLWKEISIWLSNIEDEQTRNMFEWQKGYVRMKANPDSWFARAKTSTKENTEALAGVHADYVLLIVDEASGVHEAVFNTAEGALTSGNVLMVMISNGTRSIGYFFDSHHKNRDDWQTFSFDSEQSPVVDHTYVKRQEKRHGRGSDEFVIRVSGGFPRTDAMDDSGYFQLTPANRIDVQLRPENVESVYWFGRIVLGIDPAGEGKDKASFVARDRFKTVCLGELQTSNSKLIAQQALYFIKMLKLKDGDTIVDSFGVGHDVALEIYKASKTVLGREYEAIPVLVGSKPSDFEKESTVFSRKDNEIYDSGDADVEKQKDLYLNMRALLAARASKWLIQGGTILDTDPEHSDFKEQMTAIRARRGMQSNSIQLMSKKEMQKLRIPSPNKADAFSLTFLIDLEDESTPKEMSGNDEFDENVGENTLDEQFDVI